MFPATRRRGLACVIVGLVVAVGCGGDDSSSEEGLSVLFVQSAATGQLTSNGDQYILTLEGVDDQTVWFSDRPARKAGAEPTGLLLDQVFVSEEGPPNAALVWATDNGETTLVLELLSADYQVEQGSITYQTRLLEDGDGRIAEFGSSASVPTEPFDNPALFIDSNPYQEVCVLDVYNEVQDQPDNEFTVRADDDDYTYASSGPANGSTIRSAESLSWAWEAYQYYAAGVEGYIGCQAGVIVHDNTTNQDVAAIALDNDTQTGTENTPTCSSGYRCSVVVITDSFPTYHVAMIFCEGGISSTACKQRAGF